MTLLLIYVKIAPSKGEAYTVVVNKFLVFYLFVSRNFEYVLMMLQILFS